MMNSAKKTKIILLGTLLFATLVANNIDSIAKNYKNKLLNISVDNINSKSAQVTIFTENLYNLKLNPIKKDSNKYVIFLPGTRESLKNKPSLEKVKGTIDDIQVQFVPLLGSNDSYTKIIITTSNQDVLINLKNKVIEKNVKKKKKIKVDNIVSKPKINNIEITKKTIAKPDLPKTAKIAQPPKAPIKKATVAQDLPVIEEKSAIPAETKETKEENIKIVKINDTKQTDKNEGFFSFNFLKIGFLISLFIGGLVLLKSLLKRKQDIYVDEIDESFDNIDKELKKDFGEFDESKSILEIQSPQATMPVVATNFSSEMTTAKKEEVNILEHLSKYDYALLIDSNSNNIQKMAHYLAKNEINLLLAGNDRKKLKEIAQRITIQYKVNVKTYDFSITEFYKHKSFYKELEYKPTGVIFDIDYKGDAKKLNDNNNFVEVKKIIDSNFTNCISIGNIIVEELIKNGRGFMCFVKDNNIQKAENSDYIYLSSKLAILSYISGLQSKFNNRPVKIFSLDPAIFGEDKYEEQEEITEKTKVIASLF